MDPRRRDTLGQHNVRDSRDTSAAVIVLEAREIGRRAAGGRWLLDRISLQLRAGERLAIVGPSGSGKTLLLRSLAMLDPLDHGKVVWRGVPIEGRRVPEFRGQVIYLPQRPVLSEGTVLHNLRLPFAFRVHSGKQFDHCRTVELLRWLGRDESFLAKAVHHLSGGEMQIAALLRAIQLGPEILLLDEPTAALDEIAADAVEELVLKWHAEAPAERIIVWVSHNLQQARRVAHSTIQLRGGRLEGAP